MAVGTSKTHYAEAATLNSFLRGINYTAPASWYLALYTTAPNDSGGGTEVSGGAYARTPISFALPTTYSGTGSYTYNTSAVTFPTATASWGSIVAVGIFDASLGGNLLYYGTLSASETISTGQAFTIAASQLTVTED